MPRRRKRQAVTCDGSYMPLGSDAEWSPAEPAGPTTEKREQRISKEYGERGITYVVDSSELEDEVSR